MKSILISTMLLASICFACESENDEGVVVSIDITLTIEDKQGNDLLNPETEDFIDQNDIKVVYEIAGKRESYITLNDNAILDNPAGFSVYHAEGADRFHLNIFSNPTKGKAITIVELEGHEDITLVTEVSKKNGNTIVEKIWYKDNLVWPTEINNGPAYVPIVLD